MSVLSVFLLACTAASVTAWGKTGHETTALLATGLLTNEAANQVKTLLASGETLVSVSTWADDIKDDPSYKWSEPLHFINTPDDACSYDYTRDCVYNGVPHFCVAGAIANYTMQLADSQSSKETKYVALKFLTHFLGDIHQPLHTGFTGDKGGNDVELTFMGYKDNLHAVWDEYIIYQIVDTYYNHDQSGWQNALVKSVNAGGMYANQTANWGSCNTGDSSCTTIMATEGIGYACANAYECISSSSAPCPDQVAKSGAVLADKYLNQSIPIVNQRLAQGGVRLAALLNKILV